MAAAMRGGDPHQTMNGEADIGTASLEEALFWAGVYREILAMEEKVMERIRQLMSAQSPRVREEVELTNVPVIASQVARFRQRHDYWKLKVSQLQVLDGAG
ncbi:MAG TPA: hypothetical protein VG329_05355 [Candidatus Dormibacteraeota bacterium]|nr:hypothetical protein [Candidatus Dormibacteraeota bacterium]